jgi:type I pantothenate kinase
MTSGLSELVRLVEAGFTGPGPHLVGVAGAVAVGKSTIAAALAEALTDKGRPTRVLTTDAFLYPNAVLAERNITHRKGFPESYDADELVRVLDAIEHKRWPVRIPVYSHDVYDILPNEAATLDECDAVVLDGVIALQEPAVDRLDVRVYVDADEAVVRGWFCSRFGDFVTEARTNEASFYRMFVSMGPEEVRAVAESVWDGINGVNLRDHILPSRARATYVVEKGPDHEIVRVRTPT